MQISFHPQCATEASICIKIAPSDYEEPIIDRLQSLRQEALVAEGTLADILDRQCAREVVEQDALMACVQSEEIFIVGDPVLQEMQALQGALAGTFQLYIASELCDYTSQKVASAPIWAT